MNIEATTDYQEALHFCMGNIPEVIARNMARDMLRVKELIAALEASKEMIEKALPQFNWGASALSADAIRLLNETPNIVNVALRL